MPPSITIITATYNSSATVGDCLDSIRYQGVSVEHLIIDGGSSDNTLDILKSYPHVSKIISEPDRGIYDAMNKGISIASGEIIGILNSDDFYADYNTLTKVCNIFGNSSVDSCYGDLIYVDSQNTTQIRRYWKSGTYNVKKFYWGWMPPHPTFFLRRDAYEKYGKFNLDLGTSADYELMLRLLLKYNLTTAYLPEVLVKMRVGGASNASLRNRLSANAMDRKAWKVNNLDCFPWTTCLKPLRKLGQFLTAL